MRKLFFASMALLAAVLSHVDSVHAAVAYDQSITGNMIWGSGNTNGGFTVDSEGSLELALRAHVRYDALGSNGQPDDSIPNGIKSQGNGTYGPFDAGNFGPAANRASWNFDFSINSNTDGNGGDLNGLTFVLELDFDPSAAAVYTTSYDPLLLGGDTQFGTNSTANGAGSFSFSTGDNLAQNSWNYAFAGFPGFNPAANGIYSVRLSAFDGGGTLVAQSEINVEVGSVPEAASIAVWSGFAACAMAVGFWRKKRAVNA